jgi:hypothetical protein
VQHLILFLSSNESTNPDASLFHSSGEKRRKTGSGRGFAHSELVGVDVDAKRFWQADRRRHSRNLDPYECQRPLIPFAIGKLPP